MNIGQFSDTFLPIVDGVGRVVSAYAENLARMGHQVTVVTPMNDTGFRGGLPYEIVDYSGFSVPGYKQYQTGEAIMDAHYRRRMRMISLDICHAHSPFMAGTEALRIAANRNIPLVTTFHSKYYDDFLKTTGSEQLARVGTKYVISFYNQCDDVWTVNDNTADILRSYGYDGDIQIMENGVRSYQVSKQDIENVENRFSLGTLPLLLFVGQMNWKKNILRVLEAAKLLRDKGRHFKLILAGQGPDMGQIVRTVTQLQLEDICIIPGHISDPMTLGALYARASLFVFPSLYDNGPMVVREAAVMGTPSVMVRGSTASDGIEDNVNGFLCEDDSMDLMCLLDRVLNDEALLSSVAAQAQASIPVSWSDVLNRVEKRYQELIERGKQGKLVHKTKRVF